MLDSLHVESAHMNESQNSQPVVVTDRLTKHFKSVRALTDFSCEVLQGEVVGLLGPNGSGKSTLVRLLMGFMTPTSGSATILGLDSQNDRVDVHEKIAYLPGDARLFRTMRGTDALKFFASIRHSADVDRATEIADRLELDLNRWIAFMSTGMRQKLALAAVMSLDTPLLILDEPTANLDPTVRNEVLQLVKSSSQAGRTVLFSSHVLSEIEEICDRVIMLRQGELVHAQSVGVAGQQHQIRATLKNASEEQLTEIRQRDAVELNDFSGDWQLSCCCSSSESLAQNLNWLSTLPVADLRIQPDDLKSVYERFHQARS